MVFGYGSRINVQLSFYKANFTIVLSLKTLQWLPVDLKTASTPQAVL